MTRAFVVFRKRRLYFLQHDELMIFVRIGQVEIVVSVHHNRTLVGTDGHEMQWSNRDVDLTGLASIF